MIPADAQDGMPSYAVSGNEWRKSRRSVGDGACVEVAAVSGRIAVRDSKKKTGDAVLVPPGTWRLFIEQCKRGASAR